MAKASGKSGLSAKLGAGLKKAFAEVKDNEVQYDTGGGLPPGIENGIAQLSECKFDVYKSGPNKGEYYFYAAGIVFIPKEHGGAPIEGLRTQIGPEPMCATLNAGGKRKTLRDHVDWVTNEMKKLGWDTSDVDADNPNFEEAAAALKEEQPFFRFRTWAGKATKEYPNPRTTHVWNGLVDYNPETGEAVDDDTAAGGDVEEEEVEEAELDMDDMDAVAAAADEDNEEAKAKMTELSEAAGVDCDSFETWVEVAEAIKEAEANAEEGEEESEEEEEEAEPPTKGDVVNYKAKGAKKASEYEVTLVDKKTETVTLKNLADKKIVKGVKWGDLS